MGMLIIAVAFALGFAVRRLGLPPLVGFLIAGFVLRALGVASTSEVQLAADLGVTLLMFTIGLKLNLGTLSQPVVWAGTTLHAGSVTLIHAALLLSAATVGLGS
ncbi:MAG TPA: cation:proton antiporter, partial [Terrimesophilobacter sp.]|nr:cation:proton antiporter [Terrimesophilobacter sp.]